MSVEEIQTLYHDLTQPLWQAASIAEYYLRNTYTLRVLANFWDLAAQLSRLITAATVGLLAGFAVQAALRRLTFAVRTAVPAESSMAKTDGQSEVGILAQRFRTDLLFIAKFFGLGIFIAALVKTFLSQELVLALVGPGSVWAVPMAVALGVPLYACGGGSIPIVESMMQMGMSPGAALGFFIAGPATKFSTLTMLRAVWGRRILLFYLGLMLVGALFWGFLYPFGGENIQAKTGGVYEELIGR